MFWWQTQEEDEVAPEIELSALVNYIQPVHFKGFEACDSEYTSEKALSLMIIIDHFFLVAFIFKHCQKNLMRLLIFIIMV